MEVRLIPCRTPQRVQPAEAQAKRPPRFGGAGELISSGISFIDSSRLTELFISDGVGMVTPRSAMAYTCRGADDGRETFLREMTGLLCNVLLAGWAGLAVASLVGDRLNPYNPHGIPAKAWVNAKNLNAFGQLYEQSLQKSKNPEQAREHFVSTVLGGLESDDRGFSLESRLGSLKKLEPARQAEMLRNIWLEAMEKPLKPEQETHYLAMLKKGDGEPLKAELLKGRWGRLSAEARERLCKRFQPAIPGSSDILQGTTPFDAHVESILAERYKMSPPGTPAAGMKEHIKERLKLSRQDLNGREKNFMQAVDQDALLHGLTGSVNLKDTRGAVLTSGQNRKDMLRQMKHFLEQYVDRATYQARKTVGEDSWLRQRDSIRQVLFANTEKGWRKLFPQASDGLITATVKAKAMHTGVPIGFTVLAAGVLTFLNNYFTMKKYGGKVFFPGEGGSGGHRGAPTTLPASQKGSVA